MGTFYPPTYKANCTTAPSVKLDKQPMQTQCKLGKSENQKHNSTQLESNQIKCSLQIALRSLAVGLLIFCERKPPEKDREDI